VRTPVGTQEIVTGKVDLTPVQHWFFEQRFPEPAHYNQAVMLELDHEINPSLLRSAWTQVLRHHDALRLRFVETTSGWEQSIDGVGNQTTFHYIDLSTLAPSTQAEQVEAAASFLQTSLNLEHGPICRAVYINRGASNSALLLLIIHHLAVDAVSWPILLETLQQATRDLSELQLPAKTTSFQEWSRRLLNFAHTTEIESDAPYWLAQIEQSTTPLPVDYPGGDNLVSSEATVSVTLSTAETLTLVQQTPLAYQAQISDVLLAALAHALAQWSPEGSMLVDVEGHGREPIADDLDVSRTVGWFTSIFPLRVDLNRNRRVAAVLTSVKEGWRQLPHRGIGYGLLRYLNGSWRKTFLTVPRAELRFLYLGQLDQELSRLGIFRLAPEATGPAQNPLGKRPYLLDVNCYVRDEQFQASWIYSQKVHQRATIERLAGRFVSSLHQLIAEAAAPKAEYKSSDFPIADLSQSELDELVTSIALGSGQYRER
jgi:non-ribosomal peptide synthase protein (TIGR01720 family)